MNLHIVPDHVFINKFYENLRELGILGNNRIVVRSNFQKLRFIQHDVPFGRLYGSSFNHHAGRTEKYEKIFIHQFTPLLYRWVATHEFQELNWMVWGADLYNLPTINTTLYEDLTLKKYVKRKFSLQDFLYRAKVFFLHDRFRPAAYSKVTNMLTWMKSEYDFALHHLDTLKANHQFFFYENQLPYQDLDKVLSDNKTSNHDLPTYILGNSSTPDLNHLDAIAWMEREGIRANLCVPVSYGDKKYTRFLKKHLSSYKGGNIEFVDRFMTIHDYLQFLNRADGLIMNNIRPQGYGNIFMMMYLNKKVFLNEKNLSIPELDTNKLKWHRLLDLKTEGTKEKDNNKPAVSALLSHEALLKSYQELFK